MAFQADLSSYLVFAAQLSNLLDGLSHANLVVDEHDGDQRRIRANGSLQLL